jgi:hypothetical protein
MSHMQGHTTLRRRHMLPVEGLVMKNLGEQAATGELLARSRVSSRNLILDVALVLGTSIQGAGRLIECQVNDNVEKGAILARRKGLAARTLRAPADGRVSAIRDGRIVLQLSEHRLDLVARMPGEVIDIEPDHGVVLECVGAWVQASWGNGGLGAGLLHIVSGPNETLTAAAIDMSQRGAILLAGRCNQRQALELAAQVPIRGLILGSLATRLLPLAMKLNYPIVVTDGFGDSPMNQYAFNIFHNHEGQDATIDAQPLDIFTGQHPEVVIPQKSVGHPQRPEEVRSFQVGQMVHVIAGSQRGAIGEITALTGPSALLPNGLRVHAAEVALDGKDTVLLPLANLEVLG